VLICSSCGEENPDRFRLCGFCGAALQPEAPPQENRRTVTVVFSDLKGSTSLGERLDSERLREVLAIYFEAMSAVLVRHGGTIEKYIGDAIMAVFGLPRLHEDDALRAVRAAAEMRNTLEVVNERLTADYGVRLENRTGVYTGEVVAGDITTGQRLVTGDTVNVAARLEQAAPACEVLIGRPTYELVRDAVEVETVEPLELKGKSERVPAYQLLHAGAGEGRVRREDLPLVGRAEQIVALSEALDTVRETARPLLVTILAPAGTGKSRLVRGFLDGRGRELTSLVGRCLPYGTGITYWPIAEAVRGLARVTEDDPSEIVAQRVAGLFADIPEAGRRVASAIGLTDEAFPSEEIAWGLRRLLESRATDGPVVMVLDDIHWAEETLLELAKDLVDSVEAPLLLLCAARRDLLDDHPSWPTEGPRVRTLDLSPLTEDESNLVIGSLLGTGAVNPEVARWLIAAAEGNPLFLEQMLSMLIDDGAVHQEDGLWVAARPLGELELPATISALLAARLDRLGPTDTVVLERGSVMGQTFYRGGVEALSPEPVRPVVAASLESLETKELVRTTGDEFLGLPTYRFQHVLIRDVAYERMLKRTRADLHVAFVGWLEQVALDRLREFEEIRGYHLEQAYEIRVDIGARSESLELLGERAATHLGEAGRRAMARGDVPAAANLLRRATALLSPTHPDRPRLLLLAGEASIGQGTFAEAEKLIGTALEGASAMDDRGLQLTGKALLLELAYTTDPEGIEDTLVEQVEEMIPELQSLSDDEGLARSWRLLMLVHEMALRWGEAEEAAVKTLEHARLAGNHPLEDRAIPSLGFFALSGPTPVPEAIARCRILLDEVRGHRKAEALLMAAIAHLEAMQGDFTEARDLYRESRAILDELGWAVLAAQTSFDSGPVELLAGDPIAAEAELMHDYQTLERMGETNYISTTAALLAEAVYEQGRFADALRFTEISEELAAEDDVTSQVMWRGIRSRVLARNGHAREAVAMAREGTELVENVDSPVERGNALVSLAEVLELVDSRAEAEDAWRAAAEQFDRKGAVVSAEHARSRLEALIGAVPEEPTVPS
jgi:class 3 adenylate cyclase/tetratricopeptide (TPR) repeat protein